MTEYEVGTVARVSQKSALFPLQPETIWHEYFVLVPDGRHGLRWLMVGDECGYAESYEELVSLYPDGVEVIALPVNP